MCCLAFRIFVLFFSTISSFILARLVPDVPVVVFYLGITSAFAFGLILAFSNKWLPSFVKPFAMHYFSAIGGFLGGVLASLVGFKGLGARFVYIQLAIAIIWIMAIGIWLGKYF